MVPGRFEMASTLVTEARKQTENLSASYEASLKEKRVSIELQIGIKNVLENLRSALDYCANELYCRYGSGASSEKVYFPIAGPGYREARFKSLVGTKIPGLLQKRPDLLPVLSSFQEFSGAGNAWLPELATLCNDNKHDQLTPQERRETTELRISSKGASMSLGAGAALTLGTGATIRMGDALIPGNQRIKPGDTPRVLGQAEVENITWVSFTFTTTGKPVLPFLRQAAAGVATIVTELAARA